MTRKAILAVFLVVVLCCVGCETMGEKSKTGAVTGGLLGATAGGIIGHQSGHGWQGALIGGTAGAVAGGLIGNEMDKKAKASNPDHITVVEIAEMGAKEVPDDVIIAEINRTNSKYQLTSEIINYLKDNGVGDKVVNHMLVTGSE